MSYITRPFDFEDICNEAKNNPRGFLCACDHALEGRIRSTAARIAANADEKPVILLSGPSGSGKTTTAGKLAWELEQIGIRAHTVSLDDYFLTVNEETHPRDNNGNIDFESPDCMDIPLLLKHFELLTQGGEVEVPHFDFKNQRRHPDLVRPLKLLHDEIAIFEGIHALNPLLLGDGRTAGREMRIYTSARANIRRAGELFYKGTWVRLTRRVIRDNNFRGWPGVTTLRLWAGIRRGEKRFISPYKELADIEIDTSLGYELCVLRDYALPLFNEIAPATERGEELREIAPRLAEFPSLPESWVSKRSLLREFIGLEEDSKGETNSQKETIQ